MHPSATLLVVEDDEPIRDLVIATVPDHWAVVAAADIETAMALAEEHQPNLAVLDLHLPGGTGVTLCTRLRGRFGTGLHIAMLTADPTEDARRDAIAAGADAFLTKPFSPVKLIELLETWSRHRREPVR
ncbi:MAG: response regulator transcription factor [Actinomycetes bacterium]